jgi:pilus assembly protein CpaE
VSHRLLLAIADPDVASSAAALAQEGEELEAVAVVDDAEEVTRALRRYEIDVVVLHDALGTVPVLDLAREIGQAFPEVGLVLIAADDSAELLRAAMQAGLRDVVSPPLSLEQLEGSVRAAAQWSRALRDRVAGEESAAGALGGQLVAVAGSKGGVGTTTVALQLTLAAVRAAPGRPVCLVDFDLQKGDLRGYLNLPYRRSVVDLVEVADEISVRHLQETLYTHSEGFRVLLAPDEGERGEEVDSGVARAVLAAVKARHALTIVDLGAQVSEASAIGAEMAGVVVVVATPDVVALRGVKRLRDLWRRLQVREDEDVAVVLNRTSRKLEIQPDLARKVVSATVSPTTIPDDFGAFEAAVNTGVPSRLEDAKLRGAFERLAGELDILPGAEEPEPPSEQRGLLSRLGGERGQSTVEVMGLLPLIAVIVLGMWQIGLVGYTYMLAGHAAREGARELATDPTDDVKKPKLNPYERRAREDLPTAWRKGAEITLPGDEDETRVEVRVRLDVPVVIPGIKSGFKIGSSADTSVESEELPPSQQFTPTPTPEPEDET